MVDGEMMLLAEENPVWKIFIGKLTIKILKHAVRETTKDNISKTTIKRVLQDEDSKRMIQPATERYPERRVTWDRGVTVIVEKDTNEVVTVMKMSKRTVENRVRAGIWIKRNWTW